MTGGAVNGVSRGSGEGAGRPWEGTASGEPGPWGGSGGQGVSDTQSERYGWRNEVTNGSEPRVTEPYGRRREWRIEPRCLTSRDACRSPVHYRSPRREPTR